jgi:hypothetical protein
MPFEAAPDGRMLRPIHSDKCAVWNVRDLDRAFDALKNRGARNRRSIRLRQKPGTPAFLDECQLALQKPSPRPLSQNHH